MKMQILALILVAVSIIDFYAIKSFNLIQALYETGQPAFAALVFVGIAFLIGILGFILLLAEIGK
jgi:hypothetical protein